MDNIRKICKAVVLCCFIISEGFAQNYNAKLWDYAVSGTFKPVEHLDGSISLPSVNVIFQTYSSDIHTPVAHLNYLKLV